MAGFYLFSITKLINFIKRQMLVKTKSRIQSSIGYLVKQRTTFSVLSGNVFDWIILIEGLISISKFTK